jgi:hypothetical protein
MDPVPHAPRDNIEVSPVVVFSQTFPARPSSIPEIRDFLNRSLAHSAIPEEDNRAVRETVAEALLDAAGPTGAIHVSLRVFPEHVEVDVLRPYPVPVPLATRGEPVVDRGIPEDGGRPASGKEPDSAASFAEWISRVLRREGMTMEVAARHLGVSVKTVNRWVGGATEPRLRDLRRIRELFGELPFR